MFSDEVDVAVHSMKDVETWLPDGLAIACILERDDRATPSCRRTRTGSRACRKARGSGPHRSARGRRWMHRPDLKVVPLRGNANTRMRKLESGDECDATLLALAGLQRLGLQDMARSILSVDEMLPAVAQGALGSSAGPTTSPRSATCWRRSPAPAPPPCDRGGTRAARRARRSCRTPIAALAQIDGDQLKLDGLLFLPDGSRHWAVSGRARRRRPSASAARPAPC